MICYAVIDTNPQFPEEAEQIQNSSFIKRIVIDDSKLVELLCRATGLDKGESESIILSDICHVAFHLHRHSNRWKSLRTEC